MGWSGFECLVFNVNWVVIFLINGSIFYVLNNNLLMCRLCIYPIGNIWVLDEEVNAFIFLGKGHGRFLKKIILFDGS